MCPVVLNHVRNNGKDVCIEFILKVQFVKEFNDFKELI